MYIPLGGSRGSLFKKIRNIFIIFVVSGFWHGAAWTFIVWGFLHALYFLPLLLFNTNRDNLGTVAEGKVFPSIKELYNMSITFILVALALVVFRADNIGHAYAYLSKVFSLSVINYPELLPIKTILFLIGFIIIEWFGRKEEYGIEKVFNAWSKPLRWGIYYVFIFIILYFYGKNQDFIYFQF